MPHAAELSIVVVATNLLQVTACLESLAALDRAEIVLVTAADGSSLQASFPRLRIVRADAHWSMPRRRAEGLRRVSATSAAVLSEDYRVEGDWAQSAVSPREQADVLVGEVLPPQAGYLARAAYLWEYLHVAPPAPAGELIREQASWAPAGAVIYRVSGLDIDAMAAARSEMDYHQAMFDSGKTFRRDPGVRVRYAPAASGFLAERRRRSREWARSRSAGMPLPLRWLTGASRIALPAVLLGRFVLRAAVRPRYWLSVLTALPVVPLFAAAETVGEIEGYLGRSA